MRLEGSQALRALYPGRWLLALAPLLLPCLAWVLLQPGLAGAFLHDDLANLRILEEVSLAQWSEGSLQHLLSGRQTSFTGRPLAMLTYLPHEASWPDDPRPFLRTNLLLHCLVGVVILGLVRRLARLAGSRDDARATIFAIVVALVWLLHPLQASTVFYTIQRMAQLSTLFMVAAIYAYVVGREHLEAQRTGRGWSWIATVPLLSLVGFYAKENAALVPLALLLVEYWLFPRSASPTRALRALRVVYLWIPSGLIAAFLLYSAGADGSVTEGYATRGFTGIERLLTQCRILFDYMHLILVPQLITGGLFYDSYPVSESLWQPWTTAPAVAGIVLLVALAIRYRCRFPLVSFGVAFFFAMHLAESSSLPLELYYEHRNYLPALGLIVAGVAAGSGLFDYRRYIGVLALVTVLAVVAVLGHLRAQNWGHPLRQAEIWVQVQPDSPRAWQNLALRNHERGWSQGVFHALEQWTRLRADRATPYLSRLAYECPDEAIDDRRWRELQEKVRHGQYSHGVHQALSRLTDQAVTGRCAGLPRERVHVLIRSMIDNPTLRLPAIRQRLWSLDGSLLLRSGLVPDAVQAYEKSREHLRNPPMLLNQARALARRGHLEEALALLDERPDPSTDSVYSPLHVYWLVHDEDALQRLRDRITSDLEARRESARRPPRPAAIDTDARGLPAQS